MLDRAAGCLLGLAIGDSLGSLVEFRKAADIAREYPGGVRDLRDGGTWNTLAGQPTDDSELALALARTLVGRDGYDDEAVATAYARWIESIPFDIGNTTSRALGAAARARTGKAAAARAAADMASQGNGSLMRVAPIGIWARDTAQAARSAMADFGPFAPASHLPNRLRRLCRARSTPRFKARIRLAMLRVAIDVARSEHDGAPVLDALRMAEKGVPVEEFQHQMGWVLIALRNAFFHLAAGTASRRR